MSIVAAQISTSAPFPLPLKIVLPKADLTGLAALIPFLNKILVQELTIGQTIVKFLDLFQIQQEKLSD